MKTFFNLHLTRSDQLQKAEKKSQLAQQTLLFFVDLALNNLICYNITNFIHGPELADPSEQRLSVHQALVSVSLLRDKKPSGSHQTCKRLFQE